MRRSCRTVLQAGSLAASLLSVSTLLAAFGGLLVSTQPAAGQGVPHRVTVRHVEQQPGGSNLRLFVDVSDFNGESIPALAPGDVEVSFGSSTLPVGAVRPYGPIAPGVRTVLMIDVSASLSEAQFSRIRKAVSGWLRDLHANDRVALLAFGDESRLVHDFTDDTQALAEALAELAPTDQQTVFHSALIDALELGQRRDAGLPSYPAIVVLTDGRDEGSGLPVEDVLSAIERSPTPVFTLGSSQLQGGERRRYLEVLKRISAASRGSYQEVDDGDLDVAYLKIRRTIERAWMIDVRAPRELADGSSQRLQVTISKGERILSAGTDFRLLPATGVQPTGVPATRDQTNRDQTTVAPPTNAQRQEPSDSSTVLTDALDRAEPVSESHPALDGEPADATVESSRRLGQEATDDETSRNSGIPAGGSASDSSSSSSSPGNSYLWPSLLLLLLAIGGGAVLFLRRTTSESTQPESQAAAPPPPMPKSGTSPVLSRTIDFVVVRGSERGKTYRTKLLARTTVGTGPDCDYLLVDEPISQDLKLTLVQEDGQIYLLGTHTGDQVMVNGLRSSEQTILRNNDLIGTRDAILRIEIAE